MSPRKELTAIAIVAAFVMAGVGRVAEKIVDLGFGTSPTVVITMNNARAPDYSEPTQNTFEPYGHTDISPDALKQPKASPGLGYYDTLPTKPKRMPKKKTEIDGGYVDTFGDSLGYGYTRGDKS
jgi:hypothetical protein